MNGDGGVGEPLALLLPPEAVELLVERVAERVLEQLREEPAPRWLYGAAAAAEHLNWPLKRVHNKIADLPHHLSGKRLMFRTDELDRAVREGV